MGQNRLIHANEFHLINQDEIHKAVAALVDNLQLAAGSTTGFDIYKVVETYFMDLEKRREMNEMLGIEDSGGFYSTENSFS